MTTIAYKDGVIAYDSRMTSGNTIIDDDHSKAYEYKGHHFFLAGCMQDIQRFVEDTVEERHELEYLCGGLMVCPEGVLWMVGSNSDEQWRMRWDPSKPAAFGSGEHFALTAMDFGKSAKEAVKYAMTRDSATGGKVRTFKLT